MMKLIDIYPAPNPARAFDAHIPLDVKWREGLASPPVYWRTGDLEQTLLEVGLHSETGQVVSLTLVSYLRASVQEAGDPDGASIEVSEVPVIDIKDWPKDRFKDESGDIVIRTGPDFIQIEMGASARVGKWLGNEIAAVGINQSSEVCAFRFGKLTSSDIDQFLDAGT